MKKNIIISFSIIAIIAGITIGTTKAYFDDIEKSKGNTFSGGSLDLKIDLQCENGLCGFPLKDLNDDNFFNECDIKPGDSGEITISWHVYGNPAWARIRLADFIDYEYGCNDAEKEAGDKSCNTPGNNQGELTQYLIFTFWMDEGSVPGWQCPGNKPCATDPQEGDNKLNGIEKVFATIPAKDLEKGVKLPYELQPSTTYYLGMKWELPAETGNIVQGDSLVGKIVMEIVQSRNNPNPWE